MLLSRLSLLFFFFLVGTATVPAAAQTATENLRNSDRCAAALVRASASHARCVAKAAARFIKKHEGHEATEDYEECSEGLEERLARAKRRFQPDECPELSAEAIDTRIRRFVVEEATAALGAPPTAGVVPGLGSAQPGGCNGNVTVKFQPCRWYDGAPFTQDSCDTDGIGASYIKIAWNPGGLSSKINDEGRTYYRVPDGTTFNGQVKFGNLFADTACQSGPAFRVDNQNGCYQIVDVGCSCQGGPGFGCTDSIVFEARSEIPGGSWSQTCVADSYDGDTMCASCEDGTVAGFRQVSSCLACPGAYGNSNGYLFCE